MIWISRSVLVLCIFLAGCAHNQLSMSSPALPPAASPRQAETTAPERVPIHLAKAPQTAGSDVSREVAQAASARGVPDAAANAPMAGAGSKPAPAAPVEKPGQPDDLNADYDASAESAEEAATPEHARIADPFEPFNRAMYHFNDKLYFWVIKPVAQGYRFMVPELARIGVSNFFTNLAFPVRFVNCLLQVNFGGAARELGRFLLNTTAGAGGLFDPASREEVGLKKQDEDLGQTLGVYGVGQGFFINWPVTGPSSPRDTLGMIVDFMLLPINYYPGSWLVPWELWAYERLNDTSLRIGDYEALKSAAIDPYVAIRDAYVQYRFNKVKERKAQRTP